MTEPFHEPDAPVSDYGRWRNARWLAGLQASADMAQEAAVQAYGQSEARRVTQAGQAGLFGHMTPEDRGAALQARQATVGSEYGRGRPLERLGGTFDHANDGPAPARVDMRSTAAPQGYMRTENPLDRINRGQR